jgi:hypothetical protein
VCVCVCVCVWCVRACMSNRLELLKATQSMAAKAVAVSEGRPDQKGTFFLVFPLFHQLSTFVSLSVVVYVGSKVANTALNKLKLNNVTVVQLSQGDEKELEEAPAGHNVAVFFVKPLSLTHLDKVGVTSFVLCCCVMLCCVMLCCVMLCCVMLCCVMLCCVMLCCVLQLTRAATEVLLFAGSSFPTKEKVKKQEKNVGKDVGKDVGKEVVRTGLTADQFVMNLVRSCLPLVGFFLLTVFQHTVAVQFLGNDQPLCRCVVLTALTSNSPQDTNNCMLCDCCRDWYVKFLLLQSWNTQFFRFPGETNAGML